MESKKPVKHDRPESPSPKELIVEDALRTLISRLEEVAPRDGREHAILFRALLRRISESVQYFRGSPLREREKLRRLTSAEMEELGVAATEARQLMRKESNYQAYLKMNEPE